MHDRAKGSDGRLSPPRSNGPEAPDARAFARAFAELSAARKTILMYPAGHGQIRKSIERARTTWDGILGSRPEITIGADKDGLILGRDSARLKDGFSREFSSILRDHDVAVVHFRQGLSSEELAAFLRVIAADPEKVRAEGGIEKALAGEKVFHIRVQSVDYSKFLHTEEEEIEKNPRRKDPDEDDSLWGGFVTHLILGTLTDTEKGIPLRSADDSVPRVIAAYLNENRLDPQMALDSYEQTMREHLDRSPASADGQTYRVANLRNLSALLEELQPGIRRQFLDATYQQCAARGDSPVVENLLSGMSHGLILEMLRHANRQGSEVSPTLLNLVQKIARVKGAGPSDGGGDPGANRLEAADPRQHKEILDLFDREAYETYVTSDYSGILKELSQDSAGPLEETALPDELKDELDALESPQLDARIARALIALMEGDAGEEEYGDYADKTFRIASELIGEGEFSVPAEILHTIQRHAREKPEPAIRSIAGSVLQRFRHPTFLSKALAAFDKWREAKDGTAQAFLSAIGPAIVPQALTLYLHRERSEEGDQGLFNLLAVFAGPVADIARQQLATSGGRPLVRLIRLVRRLGTCELIPELRPLLDSDDGKVRMEILETLVRFRDPESVDLLRRFLKVKNAGDQLRVIEIAGMYRVADLVEDLASMVRIFSFFRADYVRNEKIVEALGRIGHPGAVPVLERLAKTRFSLYPKQLARLKLLLFQSLRLYEPAHVSALLRIGARSKDTRIRAACRESLPPPETDSIGSLPTTGEV